jgi:hypothetical protein
MKALRIPGIANIFKVDEPEEIHALTQDPRIDRKFGLRTCPLNWFILKRSLSVLSFNGHRFPTMTCRDSSARQIHQQELANSLKVKAAAIRLGPEELFALTQWLKGDLPESQVGILAQQLLGSLFVPGFIATEESWAAARVLVAAPRSPNILLVTWWFASGQLGRSKSLLTRAVNDDLSGVNAIGIAVHNLVKSLRHMRTLYADTGIRSSFTPEVAAQQCLFAPISLYRQATDAGKLDQCPFPRNSLFIFEIGKASQREDGRSLVFMNDTWSQCPAAEWVPAMLEGLWLRATSKR